MSIYTLNLYKGYIASAFYSTYGYYRRENLLELARRLGILPKRAERMLNAFQEKEQAIYFMVQHSFLSEKVKTDYVNNVKDKIKRIKEIITFFSFFGGYGLNLGFNRTIHTSHLAYKLFRQ